MSQKLTIIFDLDGTLVETAPDLIRTFASPPEDTKFFHFKN